MKYNVFISLYKEWLIENKGYYGVIIFIDFKELLFF